MKILHISDLHLGKRLMDRERLPEQIEVIDEITQICEREQISLILIAGDVFDTYLPSAEAEDVFFAMLKKFAGDTRAVVLISGNHDDGIRLAASSPLSDSRGIYIFGNKPRIATLESTRPVRAVEAGEFYVIIENENGERVYINAMPYPNEARFKEEKTEESFPDKITRWIARGDTGYRGDMPHILLSHLFVLGGSTSESERNIDLGGARAVPLSCLPQEGYIALGHLHKKQSMKNARYSGSILQYSFDEANVEKSVTVLETKGKDFTVREVPLTKGKKLIRLEAENFESAVALLKRYENVFIELTLHLTAPLTSRETEALREANDGLVSLITRVAGTLGEQTVSRSTLGAKQLFVEYYRSVFGSEPQEELTAAYLELMEVPE